MNRPWELTIDNSYEEGYALGLQEARAQVIKYMYEDGDTVEEIAGSPVSEHSRDHELYGVHLCIAVADMVRGLLPPDT